MLLPILLASAQEPTITYSGVAKPVGILLKEISQQANVKLSANDVAGREVVLVSVKDLPLKGLLDKLAFVTSGEWRQGSNGMVLTPSRKTRDRESADELQARTKKLADDINKRYQMAIQKDPPASTDPFNQPGDPDQKAVDLILKQIDPAVIAALGPQERAVWATNNATAMQRSLSDCSRIITDWITAHNAAVAKMPDMSAQLAQFPKEIRDMVTDKMKPVKGAPYKGLLVMEHMPFVGGLQASLRVYDEKGAVLIQGQAMLDTGGLSKIIAQAAHTEPVKPSTGPETPIDYSADSKELMKITGSTNMSMPVSAPIPPALKAEMLHPLNKDPLAYMATDAFLSLAKADNRQIVADIPDEAYGGRSLTASTAWKSVQDLQKEIDAGELVKSADDGQVLMIRPALADTARQDRIDRPSLEALLASVVEKRVPALDDVCNFALANEQPTSTPLGTTYMMLFAPNLMGTSFTGGFVDWNMLRFYGSLDQTQRSGLRSGLKLGFGFMTSDQKGYATRLVYGSDAHLDVISNEPQSKDVITQMIHRFAGSDKDFRQEPTEILPNGLPSDGFLTCESDSEPVVFFLGDNQRQNYQTLGAQELAIFQLLKDNPAMPAGTLDLPPSGYLGSRDNLKFTFHLTEQVELTQQLTDITVSSDAATVSLNKLPSDFQTRLDQQTTEMKNSPLAMLAQLMQSQMQKARP